MSVFNEPTQSRFLRMGALLIELAVVVGLAVPPAIAWSDVPVVSAPEDPRVQGRPLSSGRSVIASGGGWSTSGELSISGTIGQADADPLQPSTGGAFAVTGGFWFTAVSQPDVLFDDGFENP